MAVRKAGLSKGKSAWYAPCPNSKPGSLCSCVAYAPWCMSWTALSESRMVAGNEPWGPFSKPTIHPLFFTLFGCRLESCVSLHSTALLQRVVYIIHSVQNMYQGLYLQRVSITHFFHMLFLVMLFT